MKLLATLLIVLALTLCVGAQQPQATPSTAEMATAHNTNACGNGSDASQKECSKRDTALLFLLLGQREAAVRILCTTDAAVEGFRPYLHTSSAENIEANKKCLEAAGLK